MEIITVLSHCPLDRYFSCCFCCLWLLGPLEWLLLKAERLLICFPGCNPQHGAYHTVTVQSVFIEQCGMVQWPRPNSPPSSWFTPPPATPQSPILVCPLGLCPWIPGGWRGPCSLPSKLPFSSDITASEKDLEPHQSSSPHHVPPSSLADS